MSLWTPQSSIALLSYRLHAHGVGAGLPPRPSEGLHGAVQVCSLLKETIKWLCSFSDSHTAYKLGDVYGIHGVWIRPLWVNRGEGKPLSDLLPGRLYSRIMERKEHVPDPEGMASCLTDKVAGSKDSLASNSMTFTFLVNIYNAETPPGI